MYQAFFGLSRDPFLLDPDLDFLFASRAHEEAIAHMAYGLEQNEDIILITGDIGTGKTLALHRLLTHISTVFEPVVVNVTALDYEQLLRLVLLKTGHQAPAERGVAELLFALETALVEARGRGRKILLIVDEAQNLSGEVLEGLRMLLNLARPGEQALQLVLVGQLGLERLLADESLRQLRQRIRVAYRFEYLNREELEAYVEHRIEVAGGRPKLFHADALDRIFALSLGVPRLVNHFASKALLAAFVEEKNRVRARHVEDDEGVVDVPRPVTADAAPVEPRVSASARPVPQDPPRPVPETPPVPEAQPEPEMAAPEAPRIELVPEPPSEIDEKVDRVFAGREPRVPPRPGAHRRGAQGAAVFFWILLVIVALAVAGFTSHAWLPWIGDLVGGATVEPTDTALALTQPPAATTDETVATERDSVSTQAVPAVPEMTEPAAAPAETTAVAAQTPEPAGPMVSVHVASFVTADRARSFSRKLIGLGIGSFVKVSEEESPKVWHRVFIGPFVDKKAAMRIVSELKAAGLIDYYDVMTIVPDAT